MDTIIYLFEQTEYQYQVDLVIKSGIIFATFWLGNKIFPRWHNAANFIVVVLIFRLFLFDQVFSWYGYAKYLSVDDVGWRQKDVIDYEYKKFLKKPEHTKYLAVGSSQTRAVYGPYARKHGYPQIFSLSAMSPLDLVLYRKYIKSFGPEYILLYLSEFDLARNHGLNTAKFAPNQGLYFLELFPTLRDVAENSQSYMGLKEMFVGEFLPEYKYGFIFTGYLDKVLGKNRALALESRTNAPDDVMLKMQLNIIEQNTNSEFIDLNSGILMKFLSFCREESLNVIIVEGQYHPLAYTEKSVALNKIVHHILLEIEHEFPNVRFIPRAEVYNFKENDYRDGYHVYPKPAGKFVEQLMTYIDRMD